MTHEPRLADLQTLVGEDLLVLVVCGPLTPDVSRVGSVLGVSEIFTPGSPVQEIIDFIENAVD
jgi:methylmalonyl-CoA mutase cobalamin-binding subunit